VEFWPQQFLLIPTQNGKFRLVYTHYGDRNHHHVENEIVKILYKNKDIPTILPINHEVWLDAEIFLGKLHRKKYFRK